MRPIFPLLLLLAASFAAADSGLSVERAWMRPTATSTGAIYLTLRNDSGASALLTGVDCLPADCMMHQSSEEGGVSTMIMLDRLVVPPHGEVSFKPGAMHIMATGLKAPFAEGAVFPITLHFKDLPDMAISVAVRKGAPK